MLGRRLSRRGVRLTARDAESINKEARKAGRQQYRSFPGFLAPLSKFLLLRVSALGGELGRLHGVAGVEFAGGEDFGAEAAAVVEGGLDSCHGHFF